MSLQSFVSAHKGFIIKLQVHSGQDNLRTVRIPVHRIDNGEGDPSYELVVKMAALFACADPTSANVILRYRDDDDEDIFIPSSDYLRDAIELYAQQGKMHIRAEIKQKIKLEENPEPENQEAAAAQPGEPKPIPPSPNTIQPTLPPSTGAVQDGMTSKASVSHKFESTGILSRSSVSVDPHSTIQIGKTAGAGAFDRPSNAATTDFRSPSPIESHAAIKSQSTIQIDHASGAQDSKIPAKDTNQRHEDSRADKTVSVPPLSVATSLSIEWKQQGADIVGDINDECGDSIALSSSGNVLAIGYPGRTGLGKNNKTCVRVFLISDGIWKPLGLPIFGKSRDRCGQSVSLSSRGTVVAVASPFYDHGKRVGGCVRIFKLKEGLWKQQGGIISGLRKNERFGWSTSLSSDGSIVAVCSPNGLTSSDERGCVRVFRRVGPFWAKIGTDIVPEAGENWTGAQVALSESGMVLAVGGLKANLNQSGVVRIFECMRNQWEQRGDDILSDITGTRHEQLFQPLSISAQGNVIAVGTSSMSKGGLVRVFEIFNGKWTQSREGMLSDAKNDLWGSSLSLSGCGKFLAIGAPSGCGGKGCVRVFKSTINGWVQQGRAIVAKVADVSFGNPLVLSSDGATIAMASTGLVGDSTNRSKVRVFSRMEAPPLQI